MYTKLSLTPQKYSAVQALLFEVEPHKFYEVNEIKAIIKEHVTPHFEMFFSFLLGNNILHTTIHGLLLNSDVCFVEVPYGTIAELDSSLNEGHNFQLMLHLVTLADDVAPQVAMASPALDLTANQSRYLMNRIENYRSIFTA